MTTYTAEPILFETLVAGEQPRLVRLCSHLTGDSHAAEDLAQETMLIAWRQRHQLTAPQGISHWLTAIARNVCRHHLRSQKRQGQYCSSLALEPAVGLEASEPAADFDVTVELERTELITLLDRALDLLPAATRGLLIQHYVDELPQAELAARLGMTSGAVAVRLHRGKLALRQALITDFRQDAVEMGLIAPTQIAWTPTRMWCPICGQHQLLGQFDHATHELQLRCPGCNDAHNLQDRISYSQLPCLREVKAYKPAFLRVLASGYDYYIKNSNAGAVPCLICSRLVPIRIGASPGITHNSPDLYTWCEQCQCGTSGAWSGLALCLPQGRAFWQKHPRLQVLPDREVEIAGAPALLTGFTSITGDATFEAAFNKNTFQVVYLQ